MYDIYIYFNMEKQLFDISKEEKELIKPNDCVNINVGVLGHVDSGKTSMCRLLTQVASTASLDKNPQSQERGITLDLGFSSFLTRVPHRFQQNIKEQYLQFTLVDCPGHASLIRTIIGGAQIIDVMLLVIDISKGIQAQTAECIIIAQLLIKNLIVIINKVDLIEQKKTLQGKIVALRKVFGKTKFGQNITMIELSTKHKQQEYSSRLKEILLDKIDLPVRDPSGPFLMLIDHCFKIKGKGTVVTGTILQGKVKPQDQIQISPIQQKTKVKSMEMFRKPLNVAKQGDRVALLMHQLEADQIERALASTPGSLKAIHKYIMDINKVRLYKKQIKSKAKFHIITGHQTAMGEIRLFYSKDKQLNLKNEFVLINDIQQADVEKGQVFGMIKLQKQIYGNENQKLIGYKYDVDNDDKICRIAFHGHIKAILNEENQLKLYKQKVKKGLVDRVIDNYTIIIKDLFSKDVNIQPFIGGEIRLEGNGQIGKIDGTFGNSGKIRVVLKKAVDISLEGTQVCLKYNKWY